MVATLRLVPLLAFTTSCGLVMDLTPEQREPTPDGGGGGPASVASTSTPASSGVTTGPGGTGGDGAGTATSGAGGEGGGGGAAPSSSGVTHLASSSPGGVVEVQSVAVDGDSTWIAGWFSGASLVQNGRDDAPPTELVAGSSTGAATTFVVGVDAEGQAFAAFPVTTTAHLEGADLWLGAQLAVDAAGALFVIASTRNGRIDLPGAEVTTGSSGFELVVARVEPSGAAVWAHRCAGALSPAAGADAGPRSLSAVHGGIVALPGGAVAVATSTDRADVVTCAALAGREPCAALASPAQLGGAVLRFDGDSGGCAGEGVGIHGNPGSAVTVDDIAVAGGDAVRVSGHVLSTSTLQPWNAALDGSQAHAFAGTLDPELPPAAGQVRSFAATGHAAFLADDGRLAGVTPSGVPVEGSFPASDLHLVGLDGTASPFGDPSDPQRLEAAARSRRWPASRW